MSMGRRIGLAILFALGCSPQPAPDPLSTSSAPPIEPSTRVEAAPASSTASSGAVEVKPSACGELGCTQYASAKAAFQAVLDKENPRIVAVGEAHAQKGTEHIATATTRFTADLLPALKAAQSDLVLELMIPDPKCKKATTKVEKNVEKPVTKSQRTTNKSEFEKMANRAKGIGIRPHVLRPSCDQLKEIADAGDNGVLKMLSLIALLSDDLTRRILVRNKKQSVDKGVVLYGGLMHNDLEPKEGREKFSFGPALSKHVAGSYVEIDLVVPEYIKETDTWRALPWVEHYDRDKLGKRVTLFQTAPKSYTLIFASQQ